MLVFPFHGHCQNRPATGLRKRNEPATFRKYHVRYFSDSFFLENGNNISDLYPRYAVLLLQQFLVLNWQPIGFGSIIDWCGRAQIYLSLSIKKTLRASSTTVGKVLFKPCFRTWLEKNTFQQYPEWIPKIFQLSKEESRVVKCGDMIHTH
jgi:hypothetical protein